MCCRTLVLVSDIPVWIAGDSRCDWNIATVEDGGPAVERICFEWDVVATADILVRIFSMQPGRGYNIL